MDADNTDFEAELKGLLAEGRKIDAIKRYREQTGAGLAEAKQAVEALERGESPPAAEPIDASLEAEIVSLLEQGRKMQAVKRYRERTGLGLKEAKDAVEAIAADRRIVTPSGGGCLGVVLLLTLILLAL
jgi:large subunit ribosomal protein L7/L12